LCIDREIFTSHASVRIWSCFETINFSELNTGLSISRIGSIGRYTSKIDCSSETSGSFDFESMIRWCRIDSYALCRTISYEERRGSTTDSQRLADLSRTIDIELSSRIAEEIDTQSSTRDEIDPLDDEVGGECYKTIWFISYFHCNCLIITICSRYTTIYTTFRRKIISSVYSLVSIVDRY
jgi:hypothetical protein